MSKELALQSNWLSVSDPSLPVLSDTSETNVSSQFMGRWSLSRLLRPLNYQEFAGITQAFYKSVSEAFATPCDIQITSSARPPVTVTIYDPGLQENLDAKNGVHILKDIPSLVEYIKTRKAVLPNSGLPVVFGQSQNTLPAISSEEIRMREIWDNANYLKISIRPIDETKAPQSAWGVIEFKGHAPKHATFYVQPYSKPNLCGQKVATDMREWGKGFRYTEKTVEHTSNVTAGFAEAKFSI